MRSNKITFPTAHTRLVPGKKFFITPYFFALTDGFPLKRIVREILNTIARVCKYPRLTLFFSFSFVKKSPRKVLLISKFLLRLLPSSKREVFCSLHSCVSQDQHYDSNYIDPILITGSKAREKTLKKPLR